MGNEDEPGNIGDIARGTTTIPAMGEGTMNKGTALATLGRLGDLIRPSVDEQG